MADLHSLHPQSNESVTLVRLMQIVRRYWLSIGLVTVFGTALAVLGAWYMDPMYRAEAAILLEPRKTHVAELDSVIQEPETDLRTTWLARSEAEVLRSKDLIGQVIERLHLLDNPAFQTEPNGMESVAHESITLVQSWFNAALASDDASARSQSSLEGVTSGPPGLGELIDIYGRSLAVQHKDETFILTLAFEAPDPALAARVANAHAAVYLENQKDRKAAAIASANAWLQEQVEAQRDKLRRSENAVQAFRTGHNLIDLGGESSVDARTTELNLALVQAQADFRTKDARLREVRSIRGTNTDPGAIAEIVDSPVIQSLRQEEATLQSTRASLATALGTAHPQWRAVESELSALREAMMEEMRRVEASLAREVEVARRRVTALQADLVQLEQQIFQDEDDRIALRELEREATANQQLFESLLDRHNEVLAQANLTTPEARLVSSARPPLEPFAPRTKVLVAFAFVTSAGLGVGLALARDRMNGTARRPEDIEHAASVPCLATLPTVPQPRKPFVVEQVVTHHAPRWAAARYVEAIRAVRALVERRAVQHEALRVLVTSSLPGEGKTMLSIALAREMARGGRRTLLIDADVRRRGASKLLGYSPALGQPPSINNDELDRLRALELEVLGFTFVGLKPFMAEGEALSAQAADHLNQILALSTHRFDRIIVDCAPVTAVADALLFAPSVDVTLLLVRWHKTEAALLGSVVQRLASAGARQVEAVLNCVDLKRRAAFLPHDFDYYHDVNRRYYS